MRVEPNRLGAWGRRGGHPDTTGRAPSLAPCIQLQPPFSDFLSAIANDFAPTIYFKVDLGRSNLVLYSYSSGLLSLIIHSYGHFITSLLGLLSEQARMIIYYPAI